MMLLLAAWMQVESERNDWVVTVKLDGSIAADGKTVVAADKPDDFAALESLLADRLKEKKYWRDPSGRTVNYRMVLVVEPATPYGRVQRCMVAGTRHGGVIKVVLTTDASLKDGEFVQLPIDKGLSPTEKPDPVRVILCTGKDPSDHWTKSAEHFAADKKGDSCAVWVDGKEIGRMKFDDAKPDVLRDAAKAANRGLPVQLSIDKEVPFSAALRMIHQLTAAEIERFEFGLTIPP